MDSFGVGMGFLGTDVVVAIMGVSANVVVGIIGVLADVVVGIIGVLADVVVLDTATVDCGV